jgi:thiaminase/transcriptional activator TenA
MTDQPFSQHLRALAEPIWAAQFSHPFVLGIGAGTLPIEQFKYWVRQDYLFLIEYCRLFGLAAARAPDLETLTRFADLLQATVRDEMDLHRAYAAELGIEPSELEAETMAPTTRAYTDFLLRIAATGDFAELTAALLPCMWGFSEIGRHLSAVRPPDPLYARWINTYADPDFADLAAWCRGLVDRLGQGASVDQRRRMETAFVTSSRYELAFWQMGWTEERWAV